MGDRENDEPEIDGTWFPVGDWVEMGTGSDRCGLSEPATLAVALSSPPDACGWLA